MSLDISSTLQLRHAHPLRRHIFGACCCCRWCCHCQSTIVAGPLYTQMFAACLLCVGAENLLKSHRAIFYRTVSPRSTNFTSCVWRGRRREWAVYRQVYSDTDTKWIRSNGWIQLRMWIMWQMFTLYFGAQPSVRENCVEEWRVV